MKAVFQALIDDIHYPISEGFVENVIIKRGLNGEDLATAELFNSSEYQGALADCLYSLLQAVNFSEADKSVGSLSDKDKERLLYRVNNIYKSIGEPLVQAEATPMVYIGG